MQITLTEARLYQCEGVTLYPGANVVNVEGKHRDRLLNNPGFKHRVKRGVISVDGAEETTEPNARELSREIIPAMTDVAKLKEYTLDSRQSVRDAAGKRLDVIDAAGKQDDE